MLRTSFIGVTIGFALLAGGFLELPGNWFLAHGAIMVGAGLVPLLTAFHLHSLRQFAGAQFDERLLRKISGGLLVGSLVTGAGIFTSLPWLTVGGLVLLFIASVELASHILPQIPRRSVKTDDPLTKGDDECMKQMRMAQYFLPTGFYWMALGAVPLDLPLVDRVFVAGVHELLIGFGLISMYAIGHLWVPRLSGIPAIAAGAIKGELHTTMLGLTGVTLGFLTGEIGFFLAFAPFVFIGFFTYMGVLGANIMKNKSQTHRVTPEFVYVPWVFAAVFWLICGVLMGLFLNVVPDELAAKYGSLRYVHIHVGLAAGMLQMVMGLATRTVPMAIGLPVPHFARGMKWSFYSFNAALVMILGGHLRGGTQDWLLQFGAVLFVLSLLMYVQAMVQKRPLASA